MLVLAHLLGYVQIAGVHTNLATIKAILHEPDFVAGRVSTRYLDEHPAASCRGRRRRAAGGHLLAVTFSDEASNRAASVTGFAPSGWRNLRTVGQRRQWLGDGEPHHVEYHLVGDSATVLLGPFPVPTAEGSLQPDLRRRIAVRLLSDRARHRPEGNVPDTIGIELDGVRFAVDVELDPDGGGGRSSRRAGSVEWTRPSRFGDHSHDAIGAGPVSPLPGRVISVHVEAGQRVSEGDLLVVVEAMKMEHKILAIGDAVVRTVCFGVGERVDTGDLLVELDA